MRSRPGRGHKTDVGAEADVVRTGETVFPRDARNRFFPGFGHSRDRFPSGRATLHGADDGFQLLPVPVALFHGVPDVPHEIERIPERNPLAGIPPPGPCSRHSRQKAGFGTVLPPPVQERCTGTGPSRCQISCGPLSSPIALLLLGAAVPAPPAWFQWTHEMCQYVEPIFLMGNGNFPVESVVASIQIRYGVTI